MVFNGFLHSLFNALPMFRNTFRLFFNVFEMVFNGFLVSLKCVVNVLKHVGNGSQCFVNVPKCIETEQRLNGRFR